MTMLLIIIQVALISFFIAGIIWLINFVLTKRKKTSKID